MDAMGLRKEKPSQLPSPAPLEKKGRRHNGKLLAFGTVGLAVGLAIGSKINVEHAFFPQDSYVATDAKPQIVAEHGFSVNSVALGKKKHAPITVITFNTASGNPAIKTPQDKFVEASFYQKTIRGDKDAPIIGLQEVGSAQATRVAQLAKKSNNFSYFYINSELSKDGNLLIMPKRFEVLKSESKPYPFMLSALSRKLKYSDIGQLYPRMWTEVRVKDRDSGNVFTVFNTHLSYTQEIQRPQSDALFAKVKEAKNYGGVILIGDLNADTRSKDYHGKRLKSKIKEAGLQDMSPEEPMNIDYVLVSGFKRVGGRVVEDLPPGIKSDHKPEEVVVE